MYRFSRKINSGVMMLSYGVLGIMPNLLTNIGRRFWWGGFVFMTLVLIAGSMNLPAFAQADSPAVSGGKLFQMRCFVCHGRDGKGHGPSSNDLAEKPQDLTDPSWQRATPDDQLRKIIQGGGLVVGRSDAMPPNPDLTPDQISALIGYIRSLAKAGG
jgi:mono/diheme cytochrome c family protein